MEVVDTSKMISNSNSKLTDIYCTSSKDGGKKKEFELTINPEEIKKVGNAYFQENQYEKAIDEYTKVIDYLTEIPDHSNHNLHIYYCNRALCHIRLENYGLAIADANAAISISPGFSKAYYRRGCAFVALGKFQGAIKCFQQAYSLKSDADTLERIKDCQREIRSIKFGKAICSERSQLVSKSIDIDSMTSTLASYKGPKYRRDPEFLVELIAHLETPGNTLHKSYMYKMVLDMIEELKKLDNIVKIEVPADGKLTVCGDIHGQFYDLLNIFKINGLPSDENPYLFNGDFVDRGSFSVECVNVLFAAKLIYPSSVHLARGNHETHSMNRLYGFQGELESKYDKTLYDLFCECFCLLPLAHLLNNKVFVVHGGLFMKDNVKLSDIDKLDRNKEPDEEGIMTDMLWSDPQPINGRQPSRRGVACLFGPDVTTKFLEDNNLDYVIRSHEVKLEGYSLEHDSKLITVFSAPNYCDCVGNKGAFIQLSGSNLTRTIFQFDAVQHPSVPPMLYANKLFPF